jgi:regulator of protease activity HflC (stomatin/prohibitin superfamily)
MSRGYRVRLPEPTWRNSTTRVASSDAMAMDVGLLEILPEAAMAGLLRERLAEDGWSKGQDGVMRRSFGAVEAELSADGRTITARSTVTRDVKVRATSEAQAADLLARASRSAEGQLSREAAEQLGAAEADIRAALQGALQKVYVEALQRKAASLGQVESVHEGRGADGELELTIKVRVP